MTATENTPRPVRVTALVYSLNRGGMISLEHRTLDGLDDGAAEMDGRMHTFLSREYTRIEESDALANWRDKLRALTTAARNAERADSAQDAPECSEALTGEPEPLERYGWAREVDDMKLAYSKAHQWPADNPRSLCGQEYPADAYDSHRLPGNDCERCKAKAKKLAVGA